MGFFTNSYKCFSCHKKIDPDSVICPYCHERQPLELRAKELGGKVADIECKKCGCKKSFYIATEFFDKIECTECGNTYYNDKDILPMQNTVIVECPYCHSKNVKKISTTSKIGSVALFGVFAAGKVSKEWHCNNCKSDF